MKTTILLLAAAAALANPGAGSAQTRYGWLDRAGADGGAYSYVERRSVDGYDRYGAAGRNGDDAAPAHAHDDSYGQAASPYVAGSYTAALEQGYDTGAQLHDAAPPVHDDDAWRYSNGYVAGRAGGDACGQWAWEPGIGRSVWAC